MGRDESGEALGCVSKRRPSRVYLRVGMWFVQSGVYGVSDNKNKGHNRKAQSLSQILSVRENQSRAISQPEVKKATGNQNIWRVHCTLKSDRLCVALMTKGGHTRTGLNRHCTALKQCRGPNIGGGVLLQVPARCEIWYRKSSLNNGSIMPNHWTTDYKTLTQDFKTLESYHGGNYFIVGWKDTWANGRNTAFSLQTNLRTNLFTFFLWMRGTFLLFLWLKQDY